MDWWECTWIRMDFLVYVRSNPQDTVWLCLFECTQRLYVLWVYYSSSRGRWDRAWWSSRPTSVCHLHQPGKLEGEHIKTAFGVYLQYYSRCLGLERSVFWILIEVIIEKLFSSQDYQRLVSLTTIWDHCFTTLPCSDHIYLALNSLFFTWNNLLWSVSCRKSLMPLILRMLWSQLQKFCLSKAKLKDS